MKNQCRQINFLFLRNLATSVSVGMIVLFLLGIGGCTDKKPKTDQASSPEAVVERIKPIGQVNVAPASEETAVTETEPPSGSAEEAVREEEELALTSEKPSPPTKKRQQNSLTQGKTIVENNCVPCHNGNLPGAPVIGNPEDWTPRLPQGKKTLIQHVINGYNAMPPKGGNPNLSEEDIAAAVTYIISQVDHP